MGRTNQPQVHLIVTCAKRKRHPPIPRLHVRDLPARGNLASAWAKRVSAATAVAAAMDLYLGESWCIAREAARESRGVRLWVMSAGLGVVSAEAVVPSYAATFASNEADAVPGDPAVWWGEMTLRLPTDPLRPRSLRRLSRRPGRFLLAVSRSYLAAVAEDLAAVTSPDRWTIISAGGGDLVPFNLRERLVPTDGSLRSSVGGTANAINVRLADRILATLPVDGCLHCHAFRVVEELREEAFHTSVRPQGRRLTDSEVAAFARNNAIGISSSLRLLRDGGLSCEQSRFARIYREVHLREARQ